MDPFLRSYNVESVLYDISSNITPISIRDQMLRAASVVDRAHRAKLIGPRSHVGGREGRPLLVIGAGIAGVIASLRALERGVETTLIDRAEAFSTLFQAHSRFVCANQYDWPASHWVERTYPWNGAPLPLDWEADTASNNLSIWAVFLTQTAASNPDFHFFPRTNLSKFKICTDNSAYPFPEHVEASLSPDDGTSARVEYARFGMVISCVGFGEENCLVGKYRGYEFWGNDNFARTNVGIRSSVRPNVLISGGGDGALQDFLRVATRMTSAREIYERLPEAGKSELEKSISYAEDCAGRGLAWSGSVREVCAINRQLETLHIQALQSYVAQAGWSIITEILEQQVIRSDPHQPLIELAYPCDHFSTCYPLNRFLVLLISRHLGVTKVLKQNTKIIDVTGRSHTCGRPDLCHGEDHEITETTATCETLREAGSGPAAVIRVVGGPFNVVVVRHGIHPPFPLFGKAPALSGRQILPYYIVP